MDLEKKQLSIEEEERIIEAAFQDVQDISLQIDRKSVV